MRPSSLHLVGVSVLLTVACGDETKPRTPFAPLDSDGQHFRDDRGRTVILRGVNARVQGVFDVSFSDGRLPLEPIPELTPADCARMAELGFNALRLPINWSGLEPVKDQISESYLLAIDAALECAENAGLVVVVDFHQDAYSKEIGEDGAPYWAIPTPYTPLGGPLEDLGARRDSQQVADAFDAFFAEGDPHGVQAEYIAAVGAVAARFADHDAVLGFEVMNEPITTTRLLYPFTYAVAAAIRARAPKKLVFFEPPAIRNVTDFQDPSDEPFPELGAVYAPHVYTLVFSDPENRLATITIDDLRPSVQNARREADAWATPLFIGEFGGGPTTTNVQNYLRFEIDLQDETLASSALWLWKEESQGAWGLYDKTAAGWVERPMMVALVSRPYAPRIAGTPTLMRWDDQAKTLTVSYERAVAAPNLLFVPERFSVASVTCDGQPVAPSGGPRRLEVPCGNAGSHTVVLSLTTP
jgi:endoglycosylceramidase